MVAPGETLFPHNSLLDLWGSQIPPGICVVPWRTLRLAPFLYDSYNFRWGVLGNVGLRGRSPVVPVANPSDPMTTQGGGSPPHWSDTISVEIVALSQFVANCVGPTPFFFLFAKHLLGVWEVGRTKGVEPPWGDRSRIPPTPLYSICPISIRPGVFCRGCRRLG